MFVYGIGMLPLTRLIKERVPDALTPWYADDAAAMAKFARIRAVYNLVEEFGPRYGYFPESSKSILVVTPGNRDRAVLKFAHKGFKVVEGSRYLGGFIGGAREKAEWLEKKVTAFASGVQALGAAAARHPQSAYAGYTRSFSAEWMYLQRVVPGIGEAFVGVEERINSKLLPSLLGLTQIDKDLRRLATLTVKQGGLGLRDPVERAAKNWGASRALCAHLVDCLKGGGGLQSHDS